MVAERRRSHNISPQKHRTVDTKTKDLSVFCSRFAVPVVMERCLCTFQGHIHALYLCGFIILSVGKGRTSTLMHMLQPK